MTAREKVLDAERQIRAMAESDCVITKFHCPFCELDTNLGDDQPNVLCCEEASTVVEAVLEHMNHLDRVETINRTMDRFEAMKARALVN